MARRSVLPPFAAQLQLSGNPAHPAFLHRAASSRSLFTNTQPNDQPRLSASLIIIKPLERLTPDGFNYQTLLLQRHHTHQTFSSAHVFPGGHLEQQDHQHQLVLEGSQEMASTASQTADGHLQRALKTCAIRETFEESGILVGLSSETEIGGETRLRNWREELVKKKISFGSIFQQQQQQPQLDQESDGCNLVSKAIDDDLAGLNYRKASKDRIESDLLTHFANFVTPAVLPKRWDTHFYMTILSSSSDQRSTKDSSLKSERNTVSVDGCETVSYVWLTPAEAIRWPVDALRLAPPQFYMLADLARAKDWRDLDGRGRAVPRLVPEFRKGSPSSKPGLTAAALILPGDPLHSSSPVGSPSSARHRIIVRSEPKNAAFCPVGVQRVGMEDVFGMGWEDLSVMVEDGVKFE